eukprot:85087_1
MNSSSLELSVVVLDVDRTLIRSVRNYTSNNPYPYSRNQSVEDYFHFTLNREPKRSNSYTSPRTSQTSSSTTHHRERSTLPCRDSSRVCVEHYHVYIRPGLKKLMTYLSYLQQNTSVKMVIASMAKRDYVDSILKGLKKHCTERKFPVFDCVLTRQSWDENQSPSSTPTSYVNSRLFQQYVSGHRKINLRFKSIEKIAEKVRMNHDTKRTKNILVVDDDMGYYDHADRVSGQIYQIPAWNGPVNSRRNRQDYTLYQQNDNELPSLGAMIQSIVDKGSIQKYLFTRVLSVFRHEYGSKHKKQVKLRKDMMNILMNDIGMEIDEDTGMSSLWIFDNVLRCCKDNDIVSIGEYIELLFGCIIVYQMYIYDVHPSAHFYRLSFTQNEFWKQVMDVYFEYYVRLLFQINDSRLKQVPHARHDHKHKATPNTHKQSATEFVNKLMKSNAAKEIKSNKNILSSDLNGSCSVCFSSNPFNCTNHIAPIEVAQSEPELLPQKSDIEAQEEVIINHNNESSTDDVTPTPNRNGSDNIILTQQTYKSIQDNLKVLVKSISKSIFSKNLSPVCFIGHNLLSASRSNPVPKCISKYQRILKKVYRERQD